MAFDYKKEYKEFYLPKQVPSIVDVPVMNFIAVRGKGDPNDEGLWWQEEDGKPVTGFDYGNKASMCWISLIRIPEFVSREEFDWAVTEVARKKGIDCSKAELLTLDEGLCAQIMHIGQYDNEPATITVLNDFINKSGYEAHIDLQQHFHHEIYLSDPRKTAPDKLKTVIRYPIKIH